LRQNDLGDIPLDFRAENTILQKKFTEPVSQGIKMYTAAGTSRRIISIEQFDQEVDRLNARLDELENAMKLKLEKLENELTADLKRLELRVDEMERKNKILLLRLEVMERRLDVELGTVNRSEVGFDKIGIA